MRGGAPKRRGGGLGVLGLALAVLAFAPVRLSAQAPASSSGSALLTAIDPLDRARIVQRLGDRAVLAWLAATASAADQLAAVRAAAWLADPAAALEPLCVLMKGRDPDIAPAAALAIAQIAERLALEVGPREGWSAAQLKSAVQALQAIAQQARVRLDLRLLATRSAAQLESLLVRLQGSQNGGQKD